MRDFWQTKLAFDSFFDAYENSGNHSRSLRIAANRALARRMFACGIGLLVRRRLSEGRQLIRASMDMDPRLRYRPPAFWILRKAASKVIANCAQVVSDLHNRTH